MAFITIQQAYALAMGVYFSFSDSPSGVLDNRGHASSTGLNTRATTNNKDRLTSLVASWNNAANLDLGDITYVRKSNNTLTTIVANANTPSVTYDLVTTTTNENGGTLPDFLEGASSIDNTAGTLSNEERNLHRSGLVIFRKIKK